MRKIDKKIIRSRNTTLETRNEEDKKYLSGYFAKFNSETRLWANAFEEISQGAFSKTLNNDIRALQDHDTSKVLGRNKSGTLILREDDIGLWGEIEINENDTDAVNLYERVKRGDVSGCSFGFNIEKEETEYREDGSVKWTIKEVDLHEVSIVTFPAYDATSIEARKKEANTHREKELEMKKSNLIKRLKGDKQ